MLTNWIRSKVQQHCTSECDLCGLTISNPSNKLIWCHHCVNYFQPEPRCRCCGLITTSFVDKCGRCLLEPPVWNRLYCIGDYQSPLSDYVSQMKYHQNYHVAYDLTYLLANQIHEPAPEIIPVPLHWTRYIRRGYNQSVVLANYLSQHLPNKPTVVSRAFKRVRATPPQQGLTFKERQNNLNRAFKLHQSPVQKHVALIDDVVTTGSTVRHLCNLLLDIEVEKIDIYCISRTPEPS